MKYLDWVRDSFHTSFECLNPNLGTLRVLGFTQHATAVLLIELLSGAEFPLGSLATLPRLFWSAWAMSIASEMVESSYPSECCTSIGARCSLSGITGSSGTSTTLGLGTASTVAGDATLLSSGSAGVRIARLLDFLRSAGVPAFFRLAGIPENSICRTKVFQ